MESAVPFLDAVEDVSGGNLKIPQSEFLSHGELAVVDQGRGLVAGYTDNRGVAVRTQSPVIVFGDHTRAIKYVDFPFAMGADGVKVLRVKEGFEPKYVYHYLTARAIPSAGYSRHFKFLKELTVPKPPLAEQRRIAAILDQADALRAKRHQVLARLDTLTQAIFRDMFGDPVEWPSRWRMTTIGDVAASVQYGTSAKAGGSGEWPILRMGNITDSGRVDSTDLKYLDLSDADVPKYTVRKGDLLFNRTNSVEKVGKAAVVRGETPFALAGYLVRVRMSPAADPEFVSAYLGSGHGKAVRRGMAKVAVNQANISASQMKMIPIALPPIDHQRMFAGLVEEIERGRARLEASLSVDGELFDVLQARAFRGDL